MLFARRCTNTDSTVLANHEDFTNTETKDNYYACDVHINSQKLLKSLDTLQQLNAHISHKHIKYCVLEYQITKDQTSIFLRKPFSGVTLQISSLAICERTEDSEGKMQKVLQYKEQKSRKKAHQRKLEAVRIKVYHTRQASIIGC